MGGWDLGGCWAGGLLMSGVDLRGDMRVCMRNAHRHLHHVEALRRLAVLVHVHLEEDGVRLRNLKGRWCESVLVRVKGIAGAGGAMDRDGQPAWIDG